MKYAIRKQISGRSIVFFLMLGLFWMMGVISIAADTADEPLVEDDLPHEYLSASFLVMDAETGEVLYETDGFSRRYPASVTKVMTALLVLENVENLSDTIVFSAHSVAIPDYASRIWVVEGESMTVLEAIYGIMLSSGNEVARALAEHVAGSVPEFVAMMNRRAVELGALNTNFVNACGLPGDGQYITAFDIALIMKEAIRHPIFVDIIATPYFNIEPTELNEDGWQLRNTNRMVRPTQPEFNEYVIGSKTGFTNAAQHTLVTYARRGEYSFIISALFAPHWRYTFADTAALIDYTYAMLTEVIEEETEEESPAAEKHLIFEQGFASSPESGELGIPRNPFDSEVNAFIPILPHGLSTAPPGSYPDRGGEITDMEAVVVASASLGVVLLAILIIWWVNKDSDYPTYPPRG